MGWQQQGLASTLYQHVFKPPVPTTTPPAVAAKSGALQAESAPKQAALPQTAASVLSNAIDSGPLTQPAALHAERMQAAQPSQAQHAADQLATGPAGSSNSSLQPVQGFELPSPFVDRPRIGSRIFVQSHFPGIAGALASEMLSWQEDTQTRSNQLLHPPWIFLYCWEALLLCVTASTSASRVLPKLPGLAMTVGSGMDDLLMAESRLLVFSSLCKSKY